MSTQTASWSAQGALAMAGRFARSTVGTKMLVALTGVVIWGFAIGHLAGNLQALLPAPEGGYAGQQVNEYAKFLHDTAPLLWGTRVLVLVSFVVHIALTMRLTKLNRDARPVRYEKVRADRSTLASRFMAVSGIFLLAFVCFHLAHFTFHWVHPSFATLRDKAGLHDVYQMTWDGFSYLGTVAFYVVAQTLLFLHLWHGAQSFLQSLGLRHHAWSRAAVLAGRVLVALLIAGNLAIPIVMFASWQMMPR